MKKIIYFSLFILAILVSANGNSFSNSNINSNINNVNSDSAEYCVVSGEAIDGDGVKYVYLNKELKFCCDGCEMSFKKNPAKYLGSAGLWCPVCDEGDAKESITYVNDDVKYYFCSKGCKSKFSSAPDTYLENYSKK